MRYMKNWTIFMLAMAFLYSVFMNQQQYAGYQELLVLHQEAKREIQELEEALEIAERSACEDGIE